MSCSSKKKVKTKGKIQHPDNLHKIKANVYVDTSHHQQRKYPESLKEKKLNLNCETCWKENEEIHKSDGNAMEWASKRKRLS